MFDYTDAGIVYLTLFVVGMGFLLVGGIVHGLNREWRQYLRWRHTHAAWKALVEGESK